MKQFRIHLIASLLAAPLVSAQTHAKVDITCNDEMTYNTKGFEVGVGQKVTLTLKNVGRIPLKTMGHNLVILRPGTSLPEFAGKASAEKKDHLPQDPELRKAILAATRILGGGESHTIYFIPKEPGAYPFICTTPGHFSVMQGVMTVKPKAD